MTDDEFLGVPNDLVMELGRMTVIAAMAEETLHLIADALNVDDHNRKQFGATVHAVRRKLRADGVPAWSRTSEQDVFKWLDFAEAPFARRGEFIHGPMAQRYDAPGLTLVVSNRFRGKEFQPASIETVRQIVASLKEVHRRGSILQQRLYHEIEPNWVHSVYPEGRLPYLTLDGTGGAGWPYPDKVEQDRVLLEHFLADARQGIPVSYQPALEALKQAQASSGEPVVSSVRRPELPEGSGQG